ncbi:MAG: hypothetical protein IPK69_09980 [Phycisphaerales bacterium]|nr:MAG: hypothetical protein IPK69_09980 [Phycisphaerales bacterium]
MMISWGREATLIVHLGTEAASHTGTPAVVHLPVVEAKPLPSVGHGAAA